jgi:hypothetical protein
MGVEMGDDTYTPGSLEKLQSLMDGYRSTALIYVAAKLGIADLLAGRARKSDELAVELGADAASLHRILRALSALKVLSEDDAGCFGLTKLGDHLRTGGPGSLRAAAILCGEERMPAWRGLEHSAMTGETAFQYVFGVDIWTHRKQHPELNALFNAGIGERTARVTQAIVAAYDFSRFRMVADVGGGQGVLLTGILKAYPATQGILFDQPHVVAGAREYLDGNEVVARCRIVGGNIFENVPEGADLQILKSVIHDWADGPALEILRNCHRALKPRGTLLVIERILPARAEQAPGVILGDLHMLAITGGRERTIDEYRSLLARSGFRLSRVIEMASPLRIIEALHMEAREESN